jgi:hypothetical protein
MIPFQNAAYAPTKLVLHWLTKAMHLEEPELTAFPIDPGWVQTDLGICAAKSPSTGSTTNFTYRQSRRA